MNKPRLTQSVREAERDLTFNEHGAVRMTVESEVADVLERETDATISSWFSRVKEDTHVFAVSLTRKERCAHLPEMLDDLVTRLRNPLPLGTRAKTSDAALDHGCLRRDQGYTPAMMVEESRMLQVSIFETLRLHAEGAEAEPLLRDVMAIADEVDSQLAQAMTGYISEARHDGKTIEA